MSGPSILPPATTKASAYARSRLFRWGAWLTAVALVFIAIYGVRDYVANPENLRATEGTLVDYTSRTATRQYGVKPGQRYRGTARTYYLRVQKPDGVLAEFSSSGPIPAPRAGWQKGQRVRVDHDVLRGIYEVKVDGEIVQDLSATRARQHAERKSGQVFAVLLLVTGLTLMTAGYLSSRKTKNPSTPPPPLPPPLPRNTA